MRALQGAQLDDALRELQIAVELQPTLLVAHLQRAAFHSQLEEHDMAVAAITAAIEHAGEDPQQLAVAYCQVPPHSTPCMMRRPIARVE